MIKFAAALTLLGMTFSTTLSLAQTDAKTIKVCQNLQKIMKPRGGPDKCYSAASEYIKTHKVKIMTGSYQVYFALSENDKGQADCRHFLKSVVASTQRLELDEAKELFENDKAQSLDQAYYSYQQCMDKENQAKAKSGSTAGSSGVK